MTHDEIVETLKRNGFIIDVSNRAHLNRDAKMQRIGDNGFLYVDKRGNGIKITGEIGRLLAKTVPPNRKPHKGKELEKWYSDNPLRDLLNKIDNKSIK
ncbi:MAG: hypothetical protein LBP75_03145 [Planctomycetota bacterium]|jgi:hypothetical protein|nr:hypothetical protein [Planctomycetota bacterium]